MSVPPARATDTFTDCGGFLEAPRGVVQSPGFPGRFPAPLACRWVIHAQPEKKIVLYFTQYFLRGAFYVTEYAHYTDEQHHYGRNPLGQISFEDDIRSMVAYKRYLVLDFHLHELTNIHLRVEEYLENVFGFNITYEIVDRSERVRQETCSVTECSYLGHCMASADFSEYSCSCFPGFFGKECQYGPYCDPDKGINMCLNEGRCRYFYGSMVNVCECPPGYEGPKCEEKEDSLGEECAKLGCSDHCTRNYNGSLQCACPDGFKLDSDNVTCVEQELYRVSVGVPVVPPGPPTWNEELAKRQATVILQLSGLRSAKRFAFDGMNFTGDAYVLLFHFYVDHSELEGVKEAVGNLMRRDNLSNLTVISSSTTIKLDPEMKLLSIENYDSSPALEGKTMMVLCTARGSDRLRFRWFKDGNEFNESLTSRNAWIMRLQNEADHKQMSIFTIDGVTTYDKGEFACEIEDFGQRERKSVRIDVMPLPQVEIKPLTASLLPGQPQSFRCLSPDENMRTFSYEWLRNGQPLGEPKNGEVVEDLLPSGSRLYLTGVKKTANYTCRVVNSAGASQKQVFVFVIAREEQAVA
nr:hypothetical protein BaRGS_034133 [Batillaria attramentaria]